MPVGRAPRRLSNFVDGCFRPPPTPTLPALRLPYHAKMALSFQRGAGRTRWGRAPWLPWQGIRCRVRESCQGPSEECHRKLSHPAMSISSISNSSGVPEVVYIRPLVEENRVVALESNIPSSLILLCLLQTPSYRWDPHSTPLPPSTPHCKLVNR